MTEKSVLLMNMGIHFAAAVNFTNYRRLIDDLIRLVTEGKGQPNWGSFVFVISDRLIHLSISSSALSGKCSISSLIGVWPCMSLCSIISDHLRKSQIYASLVSSSLASLVN